MKSNISALVIAVAAVNAIMMWLSAIIIGGNTGWVILILLALWIYPVLRAVEHIERLTERVQALTEFKELAMRENENNLEGDENAIYR